MQLRWTKYIAIISSAILFLVGLAAFFIPSKLASFLGQHVTSEILIQLYGAALIGFGYTNWLIRHSVIGGIYGRAIVTGNLIHFLAGTGILLGLILGGKNNPGIITSFVLYLSLAGGYAAVLFSGGIAKQKK